jgi:hypothetical protein
MIFIQRWVFFHHRSMIFHQVLSFSINADQKSSNNGTLTAISLSPVRKMIKNHRAMEEKDPAFDEFLSAFVVQNRLGAALRSPGVVDHLALLLLV